jgi:cephalosporin hydroxylase
MRVSLDTETGSFSVNHGDGEAFYDLHSKEAFDVVADLWVRLGWVRKYSYGFAWMGRPLIQLPDDMIRIQEVIYALQPDVIVETGIAHGGSLIYYASLMELVGKGRVIGIDIEVRPHNRAAIEAHAMSKRITMIEGSSTADETVERVKSLINPGETVMLILDSDHSRDHVAAELEAYSSLVTPGSYILSQDGVMKLVAGMPRTGGDWAENNPITAVETFLTRHPEFELAVPPRPFDETQNTPDCSHHPVGWLQRKV